MHLLWGESTWEDIAQAEPPRTPTQPTPASGLARVGQPGKEPTSCPCSHFGCWSLPSPSTASLSNPVTAPLPAFSLAAITTNRPLRATAISP